MTRIEARQLTIGTPVYCTVTGIRGWYHVTAVRPRDGYLKITGFNTWNPPHNFSLTDARKPLTLGGLCDGSLGTGGKS